MQDFKCKRNLQLVPNNRLMSKLRLAKLNTFIFLPENCMHLHHRKHIIHMYIDVNDSTGGSFHCLLLYIAWLGSLSFLGWVLCWGGTGTGQFDDREAISLRWHYKGVALTVGLRCGQEGREMGEEWEPGVRHHSMPNSRWVTGNTGLL